MVTFRFKINDSFKTNSGHPITVPKSQVDYSVLPDQGLDKGKFTMIFPRGERVSAKMYSAVAGYGPYYQLRLESGETLPKYFNIGDKVIVLLFKDGVSKYATIENRQ